jgi:hypothetical protein
MIRAVRPVIVFGFSLGIFTAQAAAVPLAPEDCVRARSEQFILEGSGVPADMSRGAEWARANLDPERLKRIARWIELQEYILFRCPRPKPPPQPESAGNTQPRDADDSAAGQKKPQKPKAAKKQPSAAQSETGDGTAPPATAAKTNKTAPQKKPRSEDAYRPPMPYSGDELQHAVPGSSVPLPANGTGLVP